MNKKVENPPNLACGVFVGAPRAGTSLAAAATSTAAASPPSGVVPIVAFLCGGEVSRHAYKNKRTLIILTVWNMMYRKMLTVVAVSSIVAVGAASVAVSVGVAVVCVWIHVLATC